LRVLVAEDEPILRLELATLLQDAGARVVGPAANLDEGVALAERYAVDVGLLDINLGGRNVSSLAERLRADDVPVVFLSGYKDPELLSPLLRGLPRLQKPAAADDIVEWVAEAARRPDSPTDRHALRT
jgi:DNA-binding NarL/FixJ family response regulator